MFIGIVLIITVAAIALLGIVNNYYIAFINNYGEMNDYYSSKYAVISTLERGLNTRRSDGSLITGIIVTGYSYPNVELDGDLNYKRIRNGELSNSGDIIYVSGYMGDYYNVDKFKLSGSDLTLQD